MPACSRPPQAQHYVQSETKGKHLHSPAPASTLRYTLLTFLGRPCFALKTASTEGGLSDAGQLVVVVVRLQLDSRSISCMAPCLAPSVLVSTYSCEELMLTIYSSLGGWGHSTRIPYSEGSQHPPCLPNASRYSTLSPTARQQVSFKELSKQQGTGGTGL